MTRAVFPARKGKEKYLKRKKERERESERQLVRFANKWNVIDSNGIEELLIV